MADKSNPLRILVFEFATSGGIGGTANDLPLVADLWNEGEMMRRSLTEDLAAAGYSVLALLSPDHPSRHTPAVSGPEPRSDGAISSVPKSLESSACGENETPRGLELLMAAVRQVDATVLIAPECGGVLGRLAEVVSSTRGKLLSPDPAFIHLAADKQNLAEHLSRTGVPVPQGRSFAAGEPMHLPLPPPWVMKPRRGAGSMGVTRIHSTASQLAEYDLRLEPYCAGQAVSVAALTGPGGPVMLEPCRQHLRDTLHFEYLGGSLPLPADLRQRALQLARRTLQSLPQTQGYVGIDMVLGGLVSGETDYVIEVNPRLTTSYMGLRQAARGNLADWMVRVALGDRELPEVCFATHELEFRVANPST